MTLSVAQSSAAVCAISGAIVTAISAGTCEVDADQPGDTTYKPASQAVQTFSVGSATPSLSVQTINFTSTPPASAIVGGPGYALAATATSGLPVAFSAAASSAGICTVTGSTVALVGAGTCTIAADQSGSTAYARGRPGAAVVHRRPRGTGDRLHLRAAGSRCGRRCRLHRRGRRDVRVDGDVQPRPGEQRYLLGRGHRRVAPADGTCTVFADQAGDAAHAAASRVAQSFTIGAGPASTSPQTISFTTAAPAAAATGGSYTPLPRPAPGLPVVYAVAPASAGVCVLSGGVVSFVGTGTCTGARRPGGQCELRPGAPGVPVVRRLTAAADPADDRLHVGGAVRGRLRRRAVRRHGDRELRSARRLLDSAAAATASARSPALRSRSSEAVPARSPRIRRVTAATRRRLRRSSRSRLPAPRRRSRSRRRRPRSTSTARPTRSPRPPRPASRSRSASLPRARPSVPFRVQPVTFLKKGDCVVNANQSGSPQYLPAAQMQQTIVVLAHA